MINLGLGVRSKEFATKQSIKVIRVTSLKIIMNIKKKILLFSILIIPIFLLTWFFFGGIECTALKVKKESAIQGVTVTGNVKSTEDIKITKEATAKTEKIFE